MSKVCFWTLCNSFSKKKEKKKNKKERNYSDSEALSKGK